jgi:hypothetical protein
MKSNRLIFMALYNNRVWWIYRARSLRSFLPFHFIDMVNKHSLLASNNIKDVVMHVFDVSPQREAILMVVRCIVLAYFLLSIKKCHCRICGGQIFLN